MIYNTPKLSILDRTKYVWISDFVYGGIDGSVTTFAVVAGVQGAQLSTAIILILGFANLFADGFSMAIGKYSSDKAELERIKKIKRLEYESIKGKPAEERQEIKDILAGSGFSGDCLDCATKVITKDKKIWVDMMMKYEFNVADETIYPVKSSLTTFFAFNIIGIIPLLSYLFKPLLPFGDNSIFVLTIVFTLFALFIVGAVKSRFSDQKWWLSGLETLIIGGVAASLAYLIGFLLKGLA
ncbi:MAG: VIT1/CCC1 transporter family protein [bacterium]|nr:VIT1/CCC1 transporter family protein [bacterium]